MSTEEKSQAVGRARARERQCGLQPSNQGHQGGLFLSQWELPSWHFVPYIAGMELHACYVGHKVSGNESPSGERRCEKAFWTFSCLSSEMDVLSSGWGGQNHTRFLDLPQEKVQKSFSHLLSPASPQFTIVHVPKGPYTVFWIWTPGNR